MHDIVLVNTANKQFKPIMCDNCVSDRISKHSFVLLDPWVWTDAVVSIQHLLQPKRQEYAEKKM